MGKNKQEAAQRSLRLMAKFSVRSLCLPLTVQNNELFSAGALLRTRTPIFRVRICGPLACSASLLLSVRSTLILPRRLLPSLESDRLLVRQH